MKRFDNLVAFRRLATQRSARRSKARHAPANSALFPRPGRIGGAVGGVEDAAGIDSVGGKHRHQAEGEGRSREHLDLSIGEDRAARQNGGAFCVLTKCDRGVWVVAVANVLIVRSKTKMGGRSERERAAQAKGALFTK